MDFNVIVSEKLNEQISKLDNPTEHTQFLEKTEERFHEFFENVGVEKVGETDYTMIYNLFLHEQI